MKFRLKSPTVDAVQWDGDATTANLFCGERYGTDWEYRSRHVVTNDIAVWSDAGDEFVGRVGDWIVRGPHGLMIYGREYFEAYWEAA